MELGVGKVEITGQQHGSLLATLAPGKRTRLRRLLYEYGPGNGTLLFLPIDQGIEHGPRDFFPNPASKDPEYQFRLAAEAGYSAIACGYGMASKYYPDYAGQVPLLLKLNSKTEIPPDGEAFSPDTDFCFEWFGKSGRPVLYHHGLDPTIGPAVIGRRGSCRVPP